MMQASFRGYDVVAAAAASVAGAMAAVYVWLVREQGERPLVWVLAVLVTGMLLAAYGIRRQAAHRRAALTTAGVALVVLGLLAILSIGLPILVAGVLALLASARPGHRTPSL
jgi:hypothetical protein